MLYGVLSKAYEELEATSKRLEMIDTLVQLFKETPTEIITKVIFLTRGKLHPSWFELPVIGIAEKSAIKAVSIATGLKMDRIEKVVQEIGDLGSTFEKIHKKKKQKTLFTTPLTVERVYTKLDKIAQTSGSGSSDLKIRTLAGLLGTIDAKQGKWILRTVLGKLRFGIGDQTILDALTIAFTGDKSNKQAVERGYNINPNLGEISKILATKGLDALNNMHVKVFTPVRMMLGQRLSSIEEILEKFGGICACEYKYDGERLQIHMLGDKVVLYTRNLENATSQYPDVCDLFRQLNVRSLVVEGEVVAIDKNGFLLPFQELMHRRRKYAVEEAIKKYPIRIFLFDILKLNEKDLLDETYLNRREHLEEIISETDQLKLATSIISKDSSEIETFFNSSIEAGCEGLMTKSTKSVYSAGARGWSWIKFKKSYEKSKAPDTIDAVIVGAYFGRGKRAKTYGTLLCAVLDKKEGTYRTICKLGSGFTDQDLLEILQKFEKVKRDTKHPQVNSMIKPTPDVWFEPRFVMEILGDELTLSNVHTAGFGKIQPNSGLAVRFPRFIRWREDKNIDDITTTDEVIDIYHQQKKGV